MAAISSTSSQTTLAQALAKLAADEAAKAAAKTITADQAAVASDEKAQTSTSASPSIGLVNVTA
jgi:hypothetical protein